MVSTIFFVQKI